MTTGELSLPELFDTLLPPDGSDDHVFSAATIPSFDVYRLAKDRYSAPAILIRAQLTARVPPPIRLEHLYVAHNVTCTIHKADGTSETGEFVVIRCTEPDRATVAYFLRVLGALIPGLGLSPSPGDVNRMIDQLSDLFRAMHGLPRKATQGLWAELFTILSSTRPHLLISSWHPTPEELFDFSSGPDRLEVKCASGQVRAHHFSLQQLNPQPGINLVIVSVITNRVGRGSTVSDLVDLLCSRVRDNLDAKVRVFQTVAATLGSNWRDGLMESFDMEQATRSIACYRPDDIPKVNALVPLGVSDVRFRSDLTACKPISGSELGRMGELASCLKVR